MNKLLSLFEQLMQIEYLQGYEFIPEWNSKNRLQSFELLPQDKTLKKAANICSLIPGELYGKSVLDIGCNKGFFSFECLKRGAERVVGIDVLAPVIKIMQEISKQDPFLKKAEFYERPFDKTIGELGNFDLLIFLSAYHYVYAQLESHDLIFSLLASVCSDSLILELPLEPDDKFAKAALQKKLQGENLNAYNCHAILHAASKYFNSVRYIGNSGFFRTRDIFLLQKPNEAEPLPCEWEKKGNPWSLVRPWTFKD